MSTSQPTRPTTHAVDTRDMVTVHRFLRREFRLVPGVVGRVDDGDVRRAATVADHLDLMTGILHYHHTAEDDCLWPLLLERVADELLQEIGAVVPRWRTSAGAAERDRLVAQLSELSAGLDEHMEAEEDHILPLAARTVSLREWEAIGEAASAHHDRAVLPLLLGMIQYEGDPEVVAEMLAKAPRLVRAVAPMLSRRAFRRYALALHGTATPPRVGLRA